MAEKLLPPEMRAEAARYLKRTKSLLARYDQAEALGVDCERWREMTEQLYRDFQAVIDYGCDGKSPPKPGEAGAS